VTERKDSELPEKHPLRTATLSKVERRENAYPCKRKQGLALGGTSPGQKKGPKRTQKPAEENRSASGHLQNPMTGVRAPKSTAPLTGEKALRSNGLNSEEKSQEKD